MPISAIAKIKRYRALPVTMPIKAVKEHLKLIGINPTFMTVRRISVMDKDQRSGLFTLLQQVASKAGDIDKVKLPDLSYLLGNAKNIKPIDFTRYDIDQVVRELFDDRTKVLNLETIRSLGNNSKSNPNSNNGTAFPAIGITLII